MTGDLMIGGPMDGERYTSRREDAYLTVDKVDPGATSPGTATVTRHTYRRVQVAGWEGKVFDLWVHSTLADEAVFPMLLDGYRRPA